MISLLVRIVDLFISFSLVGVMLAGVVFLPYLLLTSMPVYLVIAIVVAVGFVISRFL